MTALRSCGAVTDYAGGEHRVVALDDADYVYRWLRQTKAPQNIQRLALRVVEHLGGCGCDYELVEDGSVTRKRWFHEPGCALDGEAQT